MKSGMISMEELRAKVPSLQASLASQLQDALDTVELTKPAEYEQRVGRYRDLVAAKTKQDEEYQDVLLVNIEGRLGSVSEEQLAKEFFELLGGEEKKWMKRIGKLADLRAYMPGDSAEDVKAHPQRSVWEVKNKLLDKLVPYCPREQIDRCRKLRNQKLKLLKTKYLLIKVLEKQDLSPEDPNPFDLYLKYFKQEGNLDLLQGKVVKKIKKQKKDSKKENKPQNMEVEKVEKVESGESEAGKEGQMRSQETEKKKVNGQTTNSNTPEKPEQMDIEEKRPQGMDIQTEKTKQKQQKPAKTKKAPKQPKAPKVPKTPKPEVPEDQSKAAELIKPNTLRNKSIFDFFQKKPQGPCSPQKPSQQAPPSSCPMQIQSSAPTQFQLAMSSIQSPLTPVATLREQFPKPQRPDPIPKSHYIHLFMWDSGYFMNGYELARDITFTHPIDKYSEVNYEDSYQEYIEYMEILKADNLQKEEEKSQENSEESNEGTIVSDFHLSRDEISSESEAEADQQKPIVENTSGGDQWSWSNRDHNQKPGYMIMLLDDTEPLPMKLKTDKQKITNAQRFQFIRILHGSYECADDLVTKLRQKMPQISRYQIKLHMTQFSQKEKGCPRLIKGFFLSQMEELIVTEGLDLAGMIASKKAQREEFLNKRREERKKERLEKMEKEKQNGVTLLNFASPEKNMREEQKEIKEQKQQKK